MRRNRRGRTDAERDAATVEMVYAAATGALLAALGFLATTTPVLVGAAHGAARKGWYTGAVIVATAAFCGRVAWTLRRFEQRNRLRERELTRHRPDEDAAPGVTEVAGAGVAGAPGAPDRSGRPDSVPAPRVPDQRCAAPGADGGTPPDQPSQPGRTNPDS